MDWGAMIDAARNENANGVQMRGNKRYTTVAIRVEMMRRHAGAVGIETDIVQWAAENGQPIVVKATVKDETGRVLATGHAEEIRGKGNVNATSALENAETSAIGRALAALGLSGGEFASANEMDGVQRKADAKSASDDQLFSPKAAADRVSARLSKAETEQELTETWEAEAETRKAIYEAAPSEYDRVKKAAADRKAELTNNKEAA